MNIDPSKAVEEIARQAPMAAAFLIVVVVAWYFLARAWESVRTAKDEEIQRLVKLLEEAHAERKKVQAALNKLLPKSGDEK